LGKASKAYLKNSGAAYCKLARSYRTGSGLCDSW
jgi:hypothetical protein